MVGVAAAAAAAVVVVEVVVVLVVVVVAEVMRSTCHPVTAATTATQGLLRGVYGFVKAEGISGIYRGLFATVCKSASNQALRFVIFGEYKRLMWGSRPAHEMPPYVALGGGMVAGAMGSVITMPFDVLKTKMQGMRADRRTLHSTRTAHAQHTHSTCTAHAWCVHGVHGVCPSILRSPLSPPPNARPDTRARFIA